MKVTCYDLLTICLQFRNTPFITPDYDVLRRENQAPKKEDLTMTKTNTQKTEDMFTKVWDIAKETFNMHLESYNDPHVSAADKEYNLNRMHQIVDFLNLAYDFKEQVEVREFLIDTGWRPENHEPLPAYIPQPTALTYDFHKTVASYDWEKDPENLLTPEEKERYNRNRENFWQRVAEEVNL